MGVDVAQNSAYGNSHSGCRTPTLFPSGMLVIGPLPYAFVRTNIRALTASVPETRTVVLFSIDAHSLGPSGTQIEHLE